MTLLSAADDFPVHQTPEPIAIATGERNFYDRYFWNGYTPDGALFFALAHGTYPALGVQDAAFSVVTGGVQYNLRASRSSPLLDRMDLRVGPIEVTVVAPLERHHLVVDSPEHGVRADLHWTGRTQALLEPRFTRRLGTRLFMDYTRLTQNGSWSGWIEIAGERHRVGEHTLGTRDRSWGIRPVGEPDAQPAHAEPQFFWLWAPSNFDDCSTLYHLNADGLGRPWNTFGALVPCGGRGDGSAPLEFDEVESKLELIPGTRHAQAAEIKMTSAREQLTLRLERRFEFFMSGIGYGHPEWRHGRRHQAPLVTGFDEIAHDGLDLNDPLHLHVQAFSDVALERASDGSTHKGLGILEQLILGRYEPLGLEGLTGPT